MRGHQIAWRPDGKTLEFSFHGLWGETERQAWERDFTGHMTGAEAGFRFFVDFSDYPAQDRETGAFHSHMMTVALDLGLAGAVHVVPSAVVRQQMKRSSDASPVGDRFLYAETIAQGEQLLRRLDAAGPAAPKPAEVTAVATSVSPTAGIQGNAPTDSRAVTPGALLIVLVGNALCVASAVLAVRSGPFGGAVAIAAALVTAVASIRFAPGLARSAVPVGGVDIVPGHLAIDIRHAADSLALQAAKLHERGQTLALVANEVDRASSSVAHDASSVGDRLREVAADTVEMSNSIAEINEQTTSARRLTTSAADKTGHTKQLVAALDQSSREIGTVVSLIRTIADQTNMLALNATIEAARAGEAGRGFAVVATEVKGLSQATANATKQIEDKVGAIQRSVLETVAAIDEIANLVAEVSGAQSVVAGAVDGQLHVTSKIGAAVEGTTTDSSAMVLRVRELAFATQEVSASVGATVEVATELSALNQVMQELARATATLN